MPGYKGPVWKYRVGQIVVQGATPVEIFLYARDQIAAQERVDYLDAELNSLSCRSNFVLTEPVEVAECKAYMVYFRWEFNDEYHYGHRTIVATSPDSARMAAEEHVEVYEDCSRMSIEVLYAKEAVKNA